MNNFTLKYKCALTSANKKALFYMLFFGVFLLHANLSLAQELLGNCSQGATVTGGEQIDVVYMGNNSLPYSASASARPGQINTLVYHYPYGSCDPIQSVRYGHTFDSGRGGFFGYHFYVAQDGRVYQGAPMFKRTNHTNPSSSRGVVNYNNNTSIGVTLVCGEKGPSAQQVASALKIGQALQVAYGVPNNRVFGHGEIQSTRGPGEGAPAQQRVRAGTPQPPYTLNYVTGSSKTVCVVDGPVPAGCSQNNCGYNFPVGTVQGGQSFNGNLHDPRNLDNPTAKQDLPLLQQNYPGMLPKEFQKPDTKNGLNLDPNSLANLNTLPKSNQTSTSTGASLLGNDCSETSISEKKARVAYYYNQYQKSFKTKYGEWNKLESSRASLSQKISLEFVVALFYSRQIRSNLEYIKKCVDVVNLK